MTIPHLSEGDKAEIVKRILAFSLDEPDAPRPFCSRLAHEQGWTLAYTARVCEEYKRFLAISAVMGHPVSPSNDVDQAWHLHLLFTRSYWEDLCKGILGFPLHHHPASGQPKQAQTFSDWYQKTLESYASLFGQKPPQDIWPTREAHGEWRRVNTRKAWILPKPRLFRCGVSLCMLILGAVPGPVPASTLSSTLSSTISSTISSPMGYVSVLNLPGPAFLRRYLFLFSCAFAWFLLRRLIKSFALENDLEVPESASPLELAYLAGGSERFTLAVLTELLVAESAHLHHKDPVWHMIPTAKRPPGSTAALKIWEHLRTSEPTTFKLEHFEALLEPESSRLEHQYGLLGMRPARKEYRARQRAGLEGFVLLMLLGITKVFVGIHRQRPVGFLIFLLFSTLMLTLFLAASTPTLTIKGKQFLKGRRRYYSRVKLKKAYIQGIRLPAFSAEAHWIAAMGMALHGIPFFRNLSMPGITELKKALFTGPQTQSKPGGIWWLGGGSCSSGCGGASCGGGGGGCGGGGCGGCGGD